MIEGRAQDGSLHRIHRGVYAVGHAAVGRLGTMRAALLACGDGAAISHQSAAELLRLSTTRPVLIDVSVTTGAGRKVEGIRRHESPPFLPDEVVVRERIRCTSTARTLIDMAGIAGERTIRRLTEQAAVLRQLDPTEVDRLMGRRRRRGAPMLRAVLAPWRGVDGDPQTLRSVLEARLLAAIRDCGLPPPRANAIVASGRHRLEVDFLWEEDRLVVEADGLETHATPLAFRRDRWRDQVLAAAGYRVLRITWGQLEDEPGEALARIRGMLAS